MNQKTKLKSILLSPYRSVGDTIAEAKLATLWFDKAFFDTADHIVDLFYDNLINEEIISAKDKANLTDIWTPAKNVLPHDYKFSIEGPFINHKRYAPDIFEGALDFHVTRMNKPLDKWNDFDGHYGYGAAAATVETVRLWTTINQEFDCSLIPRDIEKYSLEKTVDKRNNEKGFATFKEIGSLYVPDFTKISWANILKLKINPGLDELKEVISHLDSQNANDENLLNEFKAIERETSLCFVEENRQYTGDVVVKSLLTNIPGLPVNPFGIADGLSSISHTKQMNEKYSWLMFLLDLKNA